MCFVFFQSKAHDATEAFFTINNLENKITVDANFPWTIRKALLKFKPELEYKKVNLDFEKAFFDYVKENFIIADKHNKQLKLLNVILNKNKDHSHETNYTFTFEKKEYLFITNSLLFNVSKKQSNHHYLFQNKSKIKFITNKESPTFEKKETSKPITFWVIISIIVLSVTLIYLIKK